MTSVFYIGDSTVAFNSIATYPQTGMSQGLPRYLKDGVIVRMGIFDGNELGDTVGYAATMMAGGEIDAAMNRYSK